MLKWLNTLTNNAETCLSFCFTEKTGQIRMTVTNRPGSFISHAMNMINLQTDNPEHFTVFIRNFGPPLQWPYTIVCFRPKSSPEFFDRTFTNFMLTCYPPEKCSINGTYKNHRKVKSGTSSNQQTSRTFGVQKPIIFQAFNFIPYKDWELGIF